MDPMWEDHKIIVTAQLYFIPIVGLTKDYLILSHNKMHLNAVCKVSVRNNKKKKKNRIKKPLL